MQHLFAAVAGGDTAAVLTVLQRHASSLHLDVSGEPSGQGLLPLHVASQAGHVAVAAALLDRGADPDAVALVSVQAATFLRVRLRPRASRLQPYASQGQWTPLLLAVGTVC